MQVFVPTTDGHAIVPIVGKETLGTALEKLDRGGSIRDHLLLLKRGKSTEDDGFLVEVSFTWNGRRVSVMADSADDAQALVGKAQRRSQSSLRLRRTESVDADDERDSDRSSREGKGRHSIEEARLAPGSLVDALNPGGSVTVEQCERLFDDWDLDNNGYIDRDELLQVCDQLDVPSWRVMRDLDVDRDSRISKKEFLDWWSQNSQPQQLASISSSTASSSHKTRGTSASSTKQKPVVLPKGLGGLGTTSKKASSGLAELAKRRPPAAAAPAASVATQLRSEPAASAEQLGSKDRKREQELRRLLSRVQAALRDLESYLLPLPE